MHKTFSLYNEKWCLQFWSGHVGIIDWANAFGQVCYIIHLIISFTKLTYAIPLSEIGLFHSSFQCKTKIRTMPCTMGHTTAPWHRCIGENGWSCPAWIVPSQVTLSICWYYCPLCSGEIHPLSTLYRNPSSRKHVRYIIIWVMLGKTFFSTADIDLLRFGSSLSPQFTLTPLLLRTNHNKPY